MPSARNAVTLLAVLAFIQPALACDGPPACTVIDPTGTPLNVREGPNGKILGTLRKGSVVAVLDHRMHESKRWALVAKFGDAWGWVYGPYLSCENSDETGRICTVVDPTGTPLNIREEPNGRIVSTWNNGTRVRPYEERTVDGKLWYAAERVVEDNAEGWVFDPYLKCEEEGE